MRPKSSRLTIAMVQMVFIFPAALFMAALFIRSVQPLQYQPAHAAQQIVDWYAARPGIGLWGLLIGSPLVVLVIGFSTTFRLWTTEPDVRDSARELFSILTRHLPTVLTSGATLAAGGFLAIVALHLLTD